MQLSQLFSQTLRETPAEAEIESHTLLLRAGFIRPLGAGIFSYLHLAKRSMQKIESILRDEMERIGGQEISMPLVQPAGLWKQTGRWYRIGAELGRFKDRSDHDMVLAMTHEEALADLARREVQSYKQLPRLVYQLQTKWRDDPRPRAGLIRVREFTMKDSYSLDAHQQGLAQQYQRHYQAYFNIFQRCALPVIAVKSDAGTMGGNLAHEFMFLTPIGEDSLLLCDSCGYSANRQVARFHKHPAEPEPLKSLERVHTPACKSIEDLAGFLGVPKARTAKAVFFIASIPDGSTLIEKFLFAVIRCDMELNETKLASATGARDLRPATEAEILAVGAVPGFGSPIHLKPSPKSAGMLPMLVVADDSLAASPNLVAGANEPDYHLLNTNVGRDYAPDILIDIAAAEALSACPNCSAPMRMERGVEVGNLFQLGTYYSDALGCTFLDRDGQQKPIFMGSYGIGVGRLLACIAEAHHDEHGLIWPISVAPYPIHLVLLPAKNSTLGSKAAIHIVDELKAAGMEVLFDDREESPGVKFNDADLIGCPIRLTVSERSINQGGVEFKLRRELVKNLIPLDEIVPRMRAVIQSLQQEIIETVVPVPYRE